jgi:hypothetical protein
MRQASNECQYHCLPLIAEGNAEIPPQSLSRRLKLFIRRHLSPGHERAIKLYSNSFMNWFARRVGKTTKPPTPVVGQAAHLKAGDLVRVRSIEEIEATLNHWQQLRGCKFMKEMGPYCGTRQRVLKLMERFVDERDLRVKKCKGLVLLEGVMCQGTTEFGRCDRSCLIFWREEWLEKIE